MAPKLQRLYQEMVDSGVVVPVNQQVGQFKLPSVLVSVPNFTTYGVTDTSGLSDEQIAQLERHTK